MTWLYALLLVAAPAPPHWTPLGEPGCGGWLTSIAISPHDGRRILLGGDMLGLGLSEDRGEHWRPTFGLRSYEVGDCTWHPTDPLTVWAGTMSGPYVSTDGGQHWSERRTGLPAVSGGQYTAPIEKVLFDPADARHLLAFGGSSRDWQSPGQPLWGAVWDSVDAGERWTRRATLPGNVVGATYAGAGRLFAAVRGHGIFASDDGGTTWGARNDGLAGTRVERIWAGGGVLYTCTTCYKVPGETSFATGGIYRSTDAGRSWQRLGGGLPNKRAAQDFFTSGFKGFAQSASDPRVLLAGNAPYDANYLFVSTDGGGSWKQVASKQTIDVAYFSGLNATVAAIDPHDPRVMFAAGAEYLIRSLDGGATWTDCTAEHVGSGWRGRGYSGLCATNVKWDPFTPGRLLVLGMDAGKLWESRDGGGTWTYRGRDPNPWGGGNDLSLARDGHGYCATGQFGGNGGVLRTVDGNTWKALSGPAHGLPRPEQGVAESVYTLPADSSRVWCVWGGRLYLSRDGGEHFRVVPGLSGLGRIAADPRQPTRFLVSGAPTCWLTEDGLTFKPVGGPKLAGRATADSLGRFYVAAWRGSQRPGLWRFDGAWTRVSDRYLLYQAVADPRDPRRLVAIDHDHPFHDLCGAAGVWLSTDEGASWSNASDGLPILRSEAIGCNPHDPEEWVVGTNGGGFYRARWSRDYAPPGTVSYRSTADDARFAAVDPALASVTYTEVAASPGANLVRNGAMTDGAAQPSGWSESWGPVQVARDTETFKGAPASLRVSATGGTGQAFQMLGLTGARRLKVSGWLKCAGVKAQCAVQAFDEGWQRNVFRQVKFVQGDTDWTDFTGEVELPEWTARFNVQLWVEGRGTAWLDEVTVAELK